MNKPDLLMLCHRIPYPPNKGDKIRGWHVLRHLCQNWNVHLGCFIDEKSDLEHLPMLKSITATTKTIVISKNWSKFRSLKGLLSSQPLSFPYFYRSGMAEFVRYIRQTVQPSIEFAYSSSMAQYLVDEPGSVPVIIDFCDSDAEKFTAYGAVGHSLLSWIYRREGRVLANAETQLANESAMSFAITPAEAEIFNSRSGLKNPVQFFGNGVDTDYFDPNYAFDQDLQKFGISEDQSLIVFTGAMDYAANVEAVSWFADEVLPQLHDPRPHFSIVGSNPVKEVVALGDQEGISITGRVLDIRPWLLRADVVVAPLQVARGIQNKILEAMAMGKPVVATPQALEGLMGKAGEHFYECHDPKDFAQAVTYLCADRTMAQRLGRNARKLTCSDYGWDAQLARLDKGLQALLV